MASFGKSQHFRKWRNQRGSLVVGIHPPPNAGGKAPVMLGQARKKGSMLRGMSSGRAKGALQAFQEEPEELIKPFYM